MKCAIDRCGYTAGGYYGAHMCRQHDLERIEKVAKVFYANYSPPKPSNGLGESYWKTKLQAAILRLTDKTRSDILLAFDRETGQQSIW